MLTKVWRLVGPLEHRRLPGARAGARLLHGAERSSGASLGGVQVDEERYGAFYVDLLTYCIRIE